MSREQFRKKIIKSNLLDICFYNLLFAAMLIGGIFFLYDVTAHQSKWDALGTRFAGWQTAGVNVSLKQTFADDFILHEMNYYMTNAIN